MSPNSLGLSQDKRNDWALGTHCRKTKSKNPSLRAPRRTDVLVKLPSSLNQPKERIDYYFEKRK
jgi:hypothetical protein